jgi:hypothetical protein
MAYGGAAAAAHAAMAQATKASGVLVKVDSQDFMFIVSKTKNPLIVAAKGGWLGNQYTYLTSYKGLAFHTQSPRPVDLPGDAEVISAKQIWMPS